MNRHRALVITACLGAVTALAGCQGGGTPAPPARASKAPASAAPTNAPGGLTPGAPQSTTAAPGSSPQGPMAFNYDPRNRRDPFRPLIQPRVASPRPKTGLASLDPLDMKLTGIVWDQRGYYALVEAPNGLGYVIRTNDVIGDDARVTKITPQGLVVEMEARAELPREKGQKRQVEIRLRKEEER